MSVDCPYCEAKTSGGPVCAACGAILQGRAAEKRVAHGVRGSVLAGGKNLLARQSVRSRHAALQRRLHAALGAAEERTEAALNAPAPPSQARLDLVARLLIQDEVGEALKALQVARHLGASGAEFANNAGVALARRGSLSDALGMFDQAAALDPRSAAPYVNTAAALCEIWNDPGFVEKVLAAIRSAMQRDGKNPTHYARLSRVYCREERWAEAEAQARQALALAGDDPDRQADAHCALGAALYAAGCVPEAAQEFGTALKLSPGHARARADLGLLHALGSDEAEAAQALQGLREAALIDPDSPGVQAGLGHISCRSGSVNEGVRALYRALILRPSLWEPCYNLGKAYADAGLPEVAAPYLARAAQMRPQSCEAAVTHGAVNVALQRPSQAIACFEHALTRQPRNVAALVGLGVAQALCGNHAEAGRCLQAASRLDPDSPLIAGHRAWLHLRQDSASLASGELELALRKDPDRATFHNNYGLAHVSLGAPEVALLHFRRALDLNPHLYAAHYNKGCAHAMLKKPDEAMAEWMIAAEHELTNADCFSNLGTACFGREDYDTALSHFRRALQIRQDRALDFARLGLTYAKQGVILRQKALAISKAMTLIGNAQEEKLKKALEKHRLAIDQFDSALALDPGNVVLHSNRGLACYFAGRAEEAMQEWARVTQLDPLYARRRGKAQQTEYDASQMDFLPLDVPKRALLRPLKTADYLPCLAGGYDADDWTLIVSDPDLAPLPALKREVRALDRLQRALTL